MSQEDYQWMLDNMIGDDTGDNISKLNRDVNEMSAIYWARDVVVKLREHEVVKEFEVDCEAFESIHNHSAWAYQKEIK